MLENVRALVVVVALGVPSFYILGQLTGPLVARREFVVWRNVSFLVTLAAFLSIKFFAFTVFLVLICMYVRSSHAKTAGIFFILLFAVPLVDVPIGGGGIQLLLAVNNGRLLAVFLLLPILFAKRRPNHRNGAAFVAPDLLVVSFTLLQVVLEFRRADVTTVLRVLVTNSFDILIPYFVFSRTITNLSEIRSVVFAFLVAVLPMALMAPFELVKGWHLYAAVANGWGGDRFYVWRDGLLRAEGAANGAIILGHLFMVAVGCVLAMWQDTAKQRRFVAVVLLILAAGLVATLSRGPWVGCFVLIVGFVATGPRAAVNLGKLAAGSSLVLGVALLLPGGQKLLNLLPFVGIGPRLPPLPTVNSCSKMRLW